MCGTLYVSHQINFKLAHLSLVYTTTQERDDVQCTNRDIYEQIKIKKPKRSKNGLEDWIEQWEKKLAEVAGDSRMMKNNF